MFGVPRDPPWSQEHDQVTKKSKILILLLHSGKNPGPGPEFTRSWITFVQVDLDAKILQILNALSIG